jgi:transposase
VSEFSQTKRLALLTDTGERMTKEEFDAFFNKGKGDPPKYGPKAKVRIIDDTAFHQKSSPRRGKKGKAKESKTIKDAKEDDSIAARLLKGIKPFPANFVRGGKCSPR